MVIPGKNNRRNSGGIRFPFLSLFFVSAIGIGFVLTSRPYPVRSASAAPAAAVVMEKSYLSPMVEIKKRRARFVHLQELRGALLEELSALESLDHVAIYVEDLNSGVWMGINEKHPYDLASLLKTGVMIAWLKWDEENPGVLEQKIKLEAGDRDPSDRFARAIDTPLEAGEYRILNLIEKMIIYSDNTALRALSRNIPKIWVHDIFEDIGIPNPFVTNPDTDQIGKLSAKQYSQMIKSLYNASYLDPTHSAMALKILCRTKFDQGLRTALPKGMRAALKYGLWEGTALYESGIVYLDDNPYLVTIFTTQEKENVERNLSLIRAVGSIVHRYFEKSLDEK